MSMKKGIRRANGRPRQGPDQRGMVLVIALLVMVALATAGGAILALSLTESTIAKNDVEGTQALYVAEAGIQKALNAMNQCPAAAVPATGSVATGTFTITVIPPPGAPPGQQLIKAIGYVPNGGRGRLLRRSR